MKNIKRFLRKFDFFAVPFSFRYQNEDKYSTSLGGFFFISFFIIVIVVGIYYFIPFFNRKNFSIVYYSMKISKTDQIILKDSKTAIAIGFDCEVGKDGTNVEDILDLQFLYYTFKKDKEGKKNKTYEVLTTHTCNYSDFYNYYNDSVDMLNINKFKCLDKTDDIIEGIYTDESFTYYVFSVSAKEDTISNFKKIDEYLTTNECKLTFYYTDITIDLDNYEKPIQPFINNIYIHLNPIFFLKTNIFFMHQYFENDNYLFSVLNEEEPLVKTFFSRVEQFPIYKGLNRGETKPNEYKNYAKFYIRADTEKTVIKRKYQKVMEFYADSSSLLIALFELLWIIFNFINNFYADYSLTKKVFFFKEIEDSHLNINRRHKQIKELINITGPLSVKESINDPILFESNNKKLINSLSKDTEYMKDLENNEIKIFNENKVKKLKEKEELSMEKNLNNEIEKKENKEKRGIINIIQAKKNRNLNTKIRHKNLFNNNIIPIYKNLSRTMDFSVSRLNMKSNMSESGYIIKKREEKKIEEPQFEKIRYTYNIFEIIFSSFFFCCISNNLKLKKNITEKANNILYKKLDIVLFIRNMILLDIINEILINTNNSTKGIIKFLSRPIISINKKEESYVDDFYKQYNEVDFDNFYKETSKLALKSKRIEMEKKLISLSNNQLKNFI